MIHLYDTAFLHPLPANRAAPLAVVAEALQLLVHEGGVEGAADPTGPNQALRAERVAAGQPCGLVHHILQPRNEWCEDQRKGRI